MHALIIEPQAIIACTIEDTLRGCGFVSFDHACSADEAVTIADQRCPDLVTVDVGLNAGAELEAIQAICAGKQIPVIFTAIGAVDEQHGLLNSAAVQKPFQAADLLNAVRSATACCSRN